MSEQTKTSGIGGKVRENDGFSKVVGLAELKILTVNPDREEYKTILGRDLDNESKADQYLGTSKDGNNTLRIDVWTESVKSKKREKVTFFLEDKERQNKDGSKKQYINAQGSTTWADSDINVPDWFSKFDFRVAYAGEQELYDFLKVYLGKLDFKDAETTLQLDWKKLMKGNVSQIKEQINGAYSTNVVGMYIVKTVVKDEETKEYQGIYNKMFLPVYSLKNFRLVDYSNEDILRALRSKKQKELKPHERFAIQVMDSEFGCKDSFLLKDFKEYDPSDFLVASNKTLQEDDSSY